MTLPNGWEEVPIFKYLDLVKSGVKKFEGIKVYIDTRSVETGIIKDKTTEVDYESKPSRANMQVQKGDVIFAKMKDTEKIYVIGEEDSDHLYSTGFAILRVNDKSKLHPKYVYFWLRTREFQRKKNKECTGATQKAINETKLRDFTIPVPPLDVQEKIIALLEKAEQIKDWRKEADSLSKDYLKSVFVDMFGDPANNTKKLPLKKLSEVCTKITDGTHHSPTNLNEGDYPYITAKHIKKDGIDLSNLTYVSKEVHKQIYNRCNPEKGDLLYIKDGVTTGIAQVNTLDYEFSMLSSLALLKMSNSLNVYYLKYLLNHSTMYEKIRSGMGGAAITRLTLTKINDLEIPLPPIEEQTKFSKLALHFENNQKYQKEVKLNIENLFNALMQKAFKGELL